jgi:hypothetical protein
VADQNPAYLKENSDSGPHEVQRQIPFDARESIGWAQPTTPEESRIAEVNPASTWRDLVRRKGIFKCNRDVTTAIRCPGPDPSRRANPTAPFLHQHFHQLLLDGSPVRRGLSHIVVQGGEQAYWHA